MKILRRKGGYTLVEVIGYGLILVMLLNVCASILMSSKRVHTLGTLALDRNEVIEEVVADFREVAAQAIASGSSIANLRLPPDALVLTLRPEGSEQRYAVWRTDEEKRLHLEKYGVRSVGAPRLAYRKTYAPTLRVTDLTVRGEGDLVHLQFDVDNEYTPRTVPRRNSVIAMLGGGQP